jgi:hypothetical protein
MLELQPCYCYPDPFPAACSDGTQWLHASDGSGPSGTQRVKRQHYTARLQGSEQLAKRRRSSCLITNATPHLTAGSKPIARKLQ